MGKLVIGVDVCRVAGSHARGRLSYSNHDGLAVIQSTILRYFAQVLCWPMLRWHDVFKRVQARLVAAGADRQAIFASMRLLEPNYLMTLRTKLSINE